MLDSNTMTAGPFIISMQQTCSHSLECSTIKGHWD